MKPASHILNLLLLGIGILMGGDLLAQEVWDLDQISRFQVYRIDGQTIGEVEMKEVEITGEMPSKARMRKGKKRLERYTRLKWHVHKVYPYAIKVSELLMEVNAELEALPEGMKKRQYIKEKEGNLFGKYEKDIRQMSKTQGRILVKLIHRQTGHSTYHLIKDVRSGATAVFWQSIGLIFGINLKSEYDVDDDKEEDWLIERYVRELEGGAYNMVYKTSNYQLR